MIIDELINKAFLRSSLENKFSVDEVDKNAEATNLEHINYATSDLLRKQSLSLGILLI